MYDIPCMHVLPFLNLTSSRIPGLQQYVYAGKWFVFPLKVYGILPCFQLALYWVLLLCRYVEYHITRFDISASSLLVYSFAYIPAPRQ